MRHPVNLRAAGRAPGRFQAGPHPFGGSSDVSVGGGTVSERAAAALFAAFVAAAAAPDAARADAAAPPGAPIESCVSRDAIEFRRGEPRALLDAADRRRVHAAMATRYPVLQRDGVEPSHIVLWRRDGRDWLYVTLLADVRRPDALCFTATFAAAVFDFTDALLRKYFPAAS